MARCPGSHGFARLCHAQRVPGGGGAFERPHHAIADDILAMAVPDEAQKATWAETEAKLQINFRDDLAANLGGEFLLSLDGPVLAHAFVEGGDRSSQPEALENTLERLTQSMQQPEPRAKRNHIIAIDSSQIGSAALLCCPRSDVWATSSRSTPLPAAT
jgi:hypothetical protein